MAASECQGQCSKRGCGPSSACGSPDKALEAFWQTLSLSRRRQLCSVPRRELCAHCFVLCDLKSTLLCCLLC